MCGGGGDREQRTDLAFLDIQMPGLDGLDVARLAAERGDTRVIFTTAFPQYALEGFRARAIDYLLKPISFEEFSHAVERAFEWFRIRPGGQAESGVGAGAGAPQNLMVRSDYKQIVIPLSEIIYIEGIRDYIRIHTMDASGRPGSVQTLMNLKTVERMLPADRFARVHRSYIVALARVKRLERARVVLENVATPIPVSDTYRDSFARTLAARAL